MIFLRFAVYEKLLALSKREKKQLLKFRVLQKLPDFTRKHNCFTIVVNYPLSLTACMLISCCLNNVKGNGSSSSIYLILTCNVFLYDFAFTDNSVVWKLVCGRVSFYVALYQVFMLHYIASPVFLTLICGSFTWIGSICSDRT